jgi:UDP-N-acetyl-D-mannosaminuronic acid transferase (WecB/TagA/CpsF family)
MTVAPETASIMGLPFDRFDRPGLIQTFREGADSRTGGWIVTPNLDILRQFTTSPESRRLILAASYRVADGQPIVWASRLAGTPVPERLPGSDLVLSLPEAAADAGLSVFLLGGNPGVAGGAAARIARGGRRPPPRDSRLAVRGFDGWGSTVHLWDSRTIPGSFRGSWRRWKARGRHWF